VAAQFPSKANKHFAEIEKEMGNKDPGTLFAARYYAAASEFVEQ
jgi:hypothetical protein